LSTILSIGIEQTTEACVSFTVGTGDSVTGSSVGASVRTAASVTEDVGAALGSAPGLEALVGASLHDTDTKTAVAINKAKARDKYFIILTSMYKWKIVLSSSKETLRAPSHNDKLYTHTIVLCCCIAKPDYGHPLKFDNHKHCKPASVLKHYTDIQDKYTTQNAKGYAKHNHHLPW
jgi:hypothetical protein